MGGAADPEGGGSSKDPEEMFCLKWNDYQENVVATLSELRQEEDFFDVTLAVDGDQVRHFAVLPLTRGYFVACALTVVPNCFQKVYHPGLSFRNL